MKILSFKTRLLASSMALLSVFGAGQAAAQDQAAAAGDTTNVSEIVVVGTRNDAMRTQMRSDNAVSVMSAEDLEHTAVHNVAEALALLPGISVQNTGNSFFGGVEGASRGEGMFVGVRGMNSEFTLALINGVNAAQGMPYSRQVQLSLLPPSGLKTIVVNKNSTADMDGDAIGGTIDFITPSAFTFRDGYASLSVAGRVESRARDYDEDGLGGGASGEFAQRFGRNDEFGLYVSAFYDKRNFANSMVSGLMAAQNDGGWAYLHSATNSGGGTNPAGMDREANLIQTGLNLGVSTGYTERYGGNFSLDWRPDDSLDVYLRGSYAFADTQQNSTHNQIIQGRSRVFNAATRLYDLNLTDSSVRMWYTTNPEDADLSTLTFGAQKRHGAWTFSPSVFYSYGGNDRPHHIEASVRNNQSDKYNTGSLLPYSGLFVGYDKDGHAIPLLTQAQRDLLNNSGSALLARRAGQLTEQFSNQQKVGGRFDTQYDFDSGALSYVKAGVKYVQSQRRVSSHDWTNDHFANLLGRPGVTWDELGLIEGYFDSAYPGLYDVRAPKVNHDRLMELFNQYFNADAAAADLCYLNCNTLKGDENVAAAYVTGKWNAGAVEIIPGLRFENTRIENTYWNNDAQAQRFETNSTEYNEWLPSLFVNYRPTDEAVYRASITRAYMRPALVQLGGSETTSRGDNSITVTRGNPDLETLKSWNFDASGEWRSSFGGYAMVGAYYKQLSDYLYDNGSTTVNGSQTSGGTEYNGEIFDRVTIISPTNGGDGYVKGIEIQLYQAFDMLPGWMSGFGAGVNYTRQWTEVDIGGGEKHRMQNAPDELANVKLNYAWRNLTLDLNWNYSGETVMAYNRVAGLDYWTRPTRRTDLHAGYAFDNGVVLDLSVSNLFEDYSYWAHVGHNSLALSDVVDSGRTTLLTLKYDF